MNYSHMNLNDVALLSIAVFSSFRAKTLLIFEITTTVHHRNYGWDLKKSRERIGMSGRDFINLDEGDRMDSKRKDLIRKVLSCFIT